MLPRRFFDIAVPRNVHADVNDVPGSRVFNVDDLKEVSRHACAAKHQGGPLSQMPWTTSLSKLSNHVSGRGCCPRALSWEVLALTGRVLTLSTGCPHCALCCWQRLAPAAVVAVVTKQGHLPAWQRRPACASCRLPSGPIRTCPAHKRHAWCPFPGLKPCCPAHSERPDP